MRHVAVISAFMILVSHSANAQGSGRAPAARDAGIRSVVEALERSVNTRNMDGILGLYAADSTMLKNVRARYAGTLAFDSLQCREHLGAIVPRGDRAEAVVRQELTCVEHGRLQADFGWRTLVLAPGPRGWSIVGDREFEPARAVSTDLQVDFDPTGGTVSARWGEAISVWTSTVTEKPPKVERPSSSASTAVAIASIALPPYSSGYRIPRKPRAPIWRRMSRGTIPVSSHSSARGFTCS